MKIETLLGIGGYSLFVGHCSGNLYRLSIIDQENKTYNFEGIYANLQAAIERGKSVIEHLDGFEQQNTFNAYR